MGLLERALSVEQVSKEGKESPSSLLKRASILRKQAEESPEKKKSLFRRTFPHIRSNKSGTYGERGSERSFLIEGKLRSPCPVVSDPEESSENQEGRSTAARCQRRNPFTLGNNRI
jgi:hypothetical protein